MSITYCNKCGTIMHEYASNRPDCKDAVLHQCSKCGFCYESGLRHSKTINQYIKYIRFNP